MNKKIKLVVSDIDGTIIAGQEPFPEILVKAVKKLSEKGILFTFASGRLPCKIDPYMKQIGIRAPVIACNGTLLYEGKQVIISHTFSIRALKELIHKALEMDMTVLYAINGVEYCAMENQNTHRKRMERGSYHEIRKLRKEDWEKLLVDKINIMDEDGRIEELADEIRRGADEISVTHYGKQGIEIVKAGYSKATGLLEIAAGMGIGLCDVMAIGDNENDNEILKIAGIGVAVANAEPDTKAYADYVTEKAGAEGVVEAINKFCLKPA